MTFALQLTVPVLTFVLLVWGWGLPIARRLPLPPAIRFVATPFAGLLAIYLLATGFYLFEHGVELAMLSLPIGALAGWLDGSREVRSWGRNHTVRALAGGWLLVTAVALLLLTTVRNYSGGDWIGDWAGHAHRAGYFLAPEEDWSWMFAKDPLTGRPPMQNLVTAALLALPGETFANYQIFTLLLGSLAVLPAAVLVLWRNAATPDPAASARRRLGWLGLLLIASPLVLQNLTYPWTKMGTNAWVLLAVMFGWCIRDQPARAGFLLVLASGSMAAAVVTHYSAMVYLVVLAPALWWWNRRQPNRPLNRRAWTVAAGAAGLMLATWFGWALRVDGAGGLVSSTTTSQYVAETANVSAGLAAFGENVARTLVPHPLLPRPPVGPPATDDLARWRDGWFQLYQTNLLFALGSVTLATLLLARGGPLRTPLAGPIAAIVLLGIAVHPAVSHWGLAHICLQPLVLVALVWAARQLANQPPRVLRWAGPLLGLDAVLGIGLQFALQSIVVPPQVLAYQDGAPLAAIYGQAMRANAGVKQAFMYQFLGDMTPWPAAVGGGLAAALAGWWAWRLARAVRSPAPGDEQ